VAGEEPIGLEVTVDERMALIAEAVDPDAAPPPLFGPRDEPEDE
jgi:hypothetical protein